MAAAQHELLTLRGAARKLVVAVKSGVVDVHLIVQPGGTVGHLDEAAVAVAGALDFGGHVVVGHFVDDLLSLEVLVVAQHDVGTHEHLDGEEQILALFDLGHVQLGTIHGLDAVLLDGLGVDHGEDLVKRVLEEHGRAIVHFDHVTGRLAAAEAGDVEALHVLGVSGSERLVEVLGADHEVQLHFVGSKFLKRRAHEGFLLTHLFRL